MKDLAITGFEYFETHLEETLVVNNQITVFRVVL